MKPQSSLKKSPTKAPAERVVKDIRRATRRHFSAEDKIRIVLDGLRGEDSIAELCRKEGIAQSLYYVWSKSSWKLASAAWPVTPAVPQPPARSRICAVRPAL
jgi:transposase-like protein